MAARVRIVLLVLALIATAIAPLCSAAEPSDVVFALDFGSEWLKGCLVTPKASAIGQHLDVVIDAQSARKTPNLFGFDNDGERVLGAAASGLVFRAPARVFPQVKRLLGQSIEQEAAQSYASHFPALSLEATESRPSLQFKVSGDNGPLSVEEIVVQLLQLARQQANDHVSVTLEQADQQEVRKAVLTVPEHWTAGQRRLFAQLAVLAGFEPLAVVGELTAAAIDYAVRNLATAGLQRVVFYGAGTMGASASLMELMRSADGAIGVRVLRSASDASVGGYSYDLLLRDQLAERFDAAHRKGDAPSVRSNARSMAKLLRESAQVKEMLSASPAVAHFVEELFGGKDAKFDVTAEDMAQWATESGVQEKMIAPLRTVLEGESDVAAIELFGGAVRVPSLQAAVRAAFPAIPLGKHVDGDEGALLGAAHFAGVLSGIPKLGKLVVDESAVQASQGSADLALLLSGEHESVVRERIAVANARAEQRARADSARSALESALNDARTLLEKAPKKGKEAEVAKLEEALTTASTFVDDSDKHTTAEQFREALATLTGHMQPLIKAKPEPTPKATNAKATKPSPPKPKRDRRAEHARAQAAYAAATEKKNKKPGGSAKPKQAADSKPRPSTAKSNPKASKQGKRAGKDEL